MAKTLAKRFIESLTGKPLVALEASKEFVMVSSIKTGAISHPVSHPVSHQANAAASKKEPKKTNWTGSNPHVAAENIQTRQTSKHLPAAPSTAALSGRRPSDLPRANGSGAGLDNAGPTAKGKVRTPPSGSHAGSGDANTSGSDADSTGGNTSGGLAHGGAADTSHADQSANVARGELLKEKPGADGASPPPLRPGGSPLLPPGVRSIDAAAAITNAHGVVSHPKTRVLEIPRNSKDDSPVYIRMLGGRGDHVDPSLTGLNREGSTHQYSDPVLTDQVEIPYGNNRAKVTYNRNSDPPTIPYGNAQAAIYKKLTDPATGAHYKTFEDLAGSPTYTYVTNYLDEGGKKFADEMVMQTDAIRKTGNIRVVTPEGQVKKVKGGGLWTAISPYSGQPAAVRNGRQPGTGARIDVMVGKNGAPIVTNADGESVFPAVVFEHKDSGTQVSRGVHIGGNSAGDVNVTPVWGGSTRASNGESGPYGNITVGGTSYAVRADNGTRDLATGVQKMSVKMRLPEPSIGAGELQAYGGEKGVEATINANHRVGEPGKELDTDLDGMPPLDFNAEYGSISGIYPDGKPFVMGRIAGSEKFRYLKKIEPKSPSVEGASPDSTSGSGDRYREFDWHSGRPDASGAVYIRDELTHTKFTKDTTNLARAEIKVSNLPLSVKGNLGEQYLEFGNDKFHITDIDGSGNVTGNMSIPGTNDITKVIPAKIENGVLTASAPFTGDAPAPPGTTKANETFTYRPLIGGRTNTANSWAWTLPLSKAIPNPTWRQELGISRSKFDSTFGATVDDDISVEVNPKVNDQGGVEFSTEGTKTRPLVNWVNGKYGRQYLPLTNAMFVHVGKPHPDAIRPPTQFVSGTAGTSLLGAAGGGILFTAGKFAYDGLTKDHAAKESLYHFESDEDVAKDPSAPIHPVVPPAPAPAAQPGQPG
jgi:hypothetical protein